MQGHFCFIKCLIFEWLPAVDVSAICWIFDKACSCGLYMTLRYDQEEGDKRTNENSFLTHRCVYKANH